MFRMSASDCSSNHAEETVRSARSDANLKERIDDFCFRFEVDDLMGLVSSCTDIGILFTPPCIQNLMCLANEGAVYLELNLFLEILDLDESIFFYFEGNAVLLLECGSKGSGRVAKGENIVEPDSLEKAQRLLELLLSLAWESNYYVGTQTNIRHQITQECDFL